MTNDELISNLKQERVRTFEQKELFEAQAKSAAERIAQIDAAISALGGVPVVKPDLSPSVVDIVEAAARQVRPEGATFDKAALKRLASNMYPAAAEKIEKGIYNACATLVKKKVFLLAPGGYTLAPVLPK